MKKLKPITLWTYFLGVLYFIATIPGGYLLHSAFPNKHFESEQTIWILVLAGLLAGYIGGALTKSSRQLSRALSALFSVVVAFAVSKGHGAERFFLTPFPYVLFAICGGLVSLFFIEDRSEVHINLGLAVLGGVVVYAGMGSAMFIFAFLNLLHR